MRSAILACGLVSVLLIALACSSDAIGIDSCRRIEEARCKAAPACGIALGVPLREGREQDDGIQACIRFYRDACRHGLAVTQDPGTAQVDKCVASIETGDCAIVKAPELAPGCSFLASADAGPTPTAQDADASLPGAGTDASPTMMSVDASAGTDGSTRADAEPATGATDAATD